MSTIQHTSTPWGISETKDFNGIISYALCTAEGSRTIMDTFNSGVACIHEEIDEDVRRWDAQGEADINFARLAVNSHAELLDALKELLAVVRGECPSLLNEDSGGCFHLEQQIETAISHAEGRCD